MKISYATLVHNERQEIERLLNYLLKHKSKTFRSGELAG